MFSAPWRSRLPVLGSVTVEYEIVPGRVPALLLLKVNVPVGAMVLLAPNTVATRLVLEPALIVLGEACRFTVGVANLTKNVVLEEVEG